MAEATLVLAAFATTYLGFVMLALRQRRHWRQISPGCDSAAPPAVVRRRAGWLGGAGLAGGFALCLLAEGPSFGALLWVLTLAAAGVAVTFTLTWRPRALRFATRSPGHEEQSPTA